MREDKMIARWSKKDETIRISYPVGIGTVCDMNYLFSDIFNKEFIHEMTERGYDMTTIKFEVMVDKKHENFKEKYPTINKLVESGTLE